jgi:hypothetical protein
MAMDSQDEQRRRHIDGFVDSFVEANSRERYRSFLLNPKKRSEATEDLNHKIAGKLIAKYVVAQAPEYRTGSIAYIISDERELDDAFVHVPDAINLVANAYFGTVASIIPGVLAMLKPESPAAVIWLHRSESK